MVHDCSYVLKEIERVRWYRPLVIDPRLTYEMKLRAANFYRKADRAADVRTSSIIVGRQSSWTKERGSTKNL